MSRFVVNDCDQEDSPFDRQQRVSWWRQDRIEQARVMVVGAGAIGNETTKNLVLMGFRKLLICDFDHIDMSNLSRAVLFRAEDIGLPKSEVAARRAVDLALAKDPQIHWFHGDIVHELGLGIFRAMDLVLGCLDNVEARLAVNRACRLTGIPWIDAGMRELSCRVSVFAPEVPACYECGVTDTQLATARQRYSCDNVKKVMFFAGRVPTVQVASAIVGALQSQEAVKLLCGDHRSAGRMFFLEGLTNEAESFTIPTRNGCQTHHLSLSGVIPLDVGCGVTLRQFLELVSDPARSGPEATLDLRADRSLVLEATCRTCGVLGAVRRPKHLLYDHDLICLEGDSAGCRHTLLGSQRLSSDQATSMVEIAEYSLNGTLPEVLDMTLEAIGVPALHIVPVRSIDGNYIHYELAGDSARVLDGWG